jgi:hypothetical protein
MAPPGADLLALIAIDRQNLFELSGSRAGHINGWEVDPPRRLRPWASEKRSAASHRPEMV